MWMKAVRQGGGQHLVSQVDGLLLLDPMVGRSEWR